MRNQVSTAIGYVIGVVVLFPICLYLFNYFYFKYNDPSEQSIIQYTKETVALTDFAYVEYPPYTHPRDTDKALGNRTKSITVFFSKSGGGKGNYYTYTYFSDIHQKYFQLISLVEGWGVIDKAGSVYKVDAPELMITVNKLQLEDSAYGTKENPIPVLKFIGTKKSIRPNNRDYDKNYMQERYHNNVKMYLTYLMPKKEFKQHFGEY